MTCERILSHGLDRKIRDTLELCLLNNVLGGASLDGQEFAYANRLATCPEDTKIRQRWFDSSSLRLLKKCMMITDTDTAACCPPNLARTLGMIGGYTWSVALDPTSKRIDLSVYLYLSGTRTISLPGGETATVQMTTGMPWKGKTTWAFTAPAGWSWRVCLPDPSYATDVSVSEPSQSYDGFLRVDLAATASLEQTFSMPVRLLAPHPKTGQDTLTVSRGPIIYVAEAIDNESIERSFPHFQGVGLSSNTTFMENEIDLLGFKVIQLVAREKAFGLEGMETTEPVTVVDGSRPARSWNQLSSSLVYTPWFARANRGDNHHIRTSMLRVESDDV